MAPCGNGRRAQPQQCVSAQVNELPADLTLLTLDGDAIAFSEQAQCLLSLNASAAMIVQALRQGADAAEVVRLLVGQGLATTEEAGRWVSATLDTFSAHGILGDGLASAGAGASDEDAATRQAAGVPPYAPFDAATEQRYRLLGSRILIRFGTLSQAGWVNSVIGHLATDDASASTVVIDIKATRLENGELRSDVYRDTVPVGCALRVSRLAPIVKSALWQSAINAQDFLLNIHAGVVASGERCTLLPAATGSGKTSLTAALVHRGFRYFSDEVALLGPGFLVTPMPLAMGIKSTGWDLMTAYYPGILSLPVHLRNDAKELRYIRPSADALEKDPLPVSHIIFPHHVAGAPTSIERVPRSAALGHLMGECLALRLRLDPENVGRLMSWIGGIECFALTFSSLDEAVECVVAATGFDPSAIFTSH
jgi:hypothetical protein